jgi:hypothetical protein
MRTSTRNKTVVSSSPRTLPDHLLGPVGGLRDRCCDPSEDGSACVFRIEAVGLAIVSARAPVGSRDLDDLVPVAPEERGETSPVGAGALDPEGDDLREIASPPEKLGEARSIGRDGESCEDSPDEVHHRSNTDVFVGVAKITNSNRLENQ